MVSSAARFPTRLAYGAGQLPRVVWYHGHGVVMRRLLRIARTARPQTPAGSAQVSPAQDSPAPAMPVPGRGRLYLDMTALFLRDLANVEAGIYPVPADHDGPVPTLLRRSRMFFEDLPNIYRRRENREFLEVRSDETTGKRPGYFMQNFHYQSGGWMTGESAQRYDTQVEVLFSGTANAIRRQALPQIHEAFAGRDQRRLRLLDVGCGTGRTLDFVKQAWPRLPVTGLDLSEAYVAEARRHLRRWCWLDLVIANGEAIPLAAESQDAVTCVFILHELPPAVRARVFGEFARVLKPGGRLVTVDSLQLGDDPDYDGMLETFPQNYHEPYYAGYLREDLPTLAADCGLTHVRSVNAFISKVMVFDKP